MNDAYEPLQHLPDPAERYKVLAYTRGAEISSEIMDDVTKAGERRIWTTSE
jgi:hypothetical protein